MDSNSETFDKQLWTTYFMSKEAENTTLGEGTTSSTNDAGQT